MKRILAAAAFVLPLVAAGYANAEPLTLTDTQMDGVAAGVIASAGGFAASLAVGGSAAFSQTATAASVQVLVVDPVSGLQGALSQSSAGAVAAAN